MKQKERRDSTDCSQRHHGSGFEDPGEQRSGKSPFRLALEVEDLLDKQIKQKLMKRDAGDTRIRTCYVE